MVQVLLLNASYEPLTVITRRRALSLITRGRVDAACTQASEMRSVSHVLRIPTVIRLRRYVNVPRRDARWSRLGVLQRDDYICAYCGARLSKRRKGQTPAGQAATIDHVIPASRGGRNTWSNTVCACQACNQRKADRTPHEAHMKLNWEPKTPRTTRTTWSCRERSRRPGKSILRYK
jgi:5-methylcytosine-specific restriction endonuclease McrA